MNNNDFKRGSSPDPRKPSEKQVSQGRDNSPHSPPPGPQSKVNGGNVPVKSSGRLPKKEAKNELRRKKQDEQEAKWQMGIARVRTGYDTLFLVLLLILLSLGTITVFSASYPSAIANDLPGYHYILAQIKNVAFGSIGFTVAMLITPSFYRKATPVIYAAGLLLLVAVLFLGVREGEAKRWIYLGSVSFQPSEAMKPALIMALAWYYDRMSPRFNDVLTLRERLLLKLIFPLGLIGVAAGLVLLEKHLSGTAILVMIGGVVMILAGCNIKWLAASGIVVLVPTVIIYLIANPYAMKRISTLFDPNANVQDEKWQTTQGLYAIGSGGIFGLGLGNSRQKYSYVSAAHNDFIFTIWCEEMGFIGAVALLILYGVFIWHGYKIAMRAPDTFSSLVVYGIMSKIAIQVLLNIMVVTDMIPNTGISLPFFSYGGSSIALQLTEMGVVASISRFSYRKRTELGLPELSEGEKEAEAQLADK